MQLLKTISFEAAAAEEREKYQLRRTARAVVFDRGGKIALLFIAKKNYHKLPGGGIEEGESLEEALRRECREEIGCEIDIKRELGMVVEFRDESKVKQESYGYLAEVIGEKGEPNFTIHEKNEEFFLLWVNLKEAVKILEADRTDDYHGKFILERDSTFLAEVKN